MFILPRSAALPAHRKPCSWKPAEKAPSCCRQSDWISGAPARLHHGHPAEHAPLGCWSGEVVIVMNSPGQATRVLAEHQLQTSSSFLGPQVTGLLRIVYPSEVLILPSSPWRDSPCSRGWCADFSGLARCNLTFSPLESFAVLLCSVSPCQGSGCKLPCGFRSLGLTCVQCVHVRVCVHTCI